MTMEATAPRIERGKPVPPEFLMPNDDNKLTTHAAYEELGKQGLKRCPTHLRHWDQLPPEAKVPVPGYEQNPEVRYRHEFEKHKTRKGRLKDNSRCHPCDLLDLPEQEERRKSKGTDMSGQAKDTTYGQRQIEAVGTDWTNLEVWPNGDRANGPYVVHFEAPEFTCLCPRSAFPDFATIVVDYIPDELLVELKALKLYFNAFRNLGISHEAACNKIAFDLASALTPLYLRVVAEFNVRGNIKTRVTKAMKHPTYAGDIPAYTPPTFRGF